eukprot:2358476-Pyramimonas_sp.AAC.2
MERAEEPSFALELPRGVPECADSRSMCNSCWRTHKAQIRAASEILGATPRIHAQTAHLRT